MEKERKKASELEIRRRINKNIIKKIKKKKMIIIIIINLK